MFLPAQHQVTKWCDGHYEAPAWRANDRLNARAEICYQALERIIAEGPPSCAEIAKRALEEAQNVQ